MTDGGGKKEESFGDLVSEDPSVLDGGTEGFELSVDASWTTVYGDVLSKDKKSISFSGTMWKSEGMQDKKLKGFLGRDPEATHDYHGMTADKAWEKLNADLAADISRGMKVIEIIHGKGTGVLKEMVRGWLKECTSVVAFSEVSNNSGSVVVVLKKGTK